LGFTEGGGFVWGLDNEIEVFAGLTVSPGNVEL
jgi:hypothetical protein